MGDICVDRSIYHRQNDTWVEGKISVFQPYQDSDFDRKGETWRCDIAIEWPGFSCRTKHYGSDAYQSLELALMLVPSLVGATDDFHNRRLSLHEGEVILDSTTIREFFHARIIGDV